MNQRPLQILEHVCMLKRWIKIEWKKFGSQTQHLHVGKLVPSLLSIAARSCVIAMTQVCTVAGETTGNPLCHLINALSVPLQVANAMRPFVVMKRVAKILEHLMRSAMSTRTFFAAMTLFFVVMRPGVAITRMS